MKQITSPQKSDLWCRARAGRQTGSRIANAGGYLKVKSKNGPAGSPNGDRIKYVRSLIWERLSGLLCDNPTTSYMERGEQEEEPARSFYESITRQMVIPVSFIIHDEFSWAGASADGLIGREGVLELKNPAGTTHLGYFDEKTLPADYVPQCAWEMFCPGKHIRFVDFMSFDRRISATAPNVCYFLRRVGRDELEYEVGYGETARKLTGEAVVDYFVEEGLKVEAEIAAYMDKHGCKPVAPFSVDLIEEEEPAEPAEDAYDDSKPLHEQCGFLDHGAAALMDTP